MRQVEEFLRLLDSAIVAAIDKGHLRRPTADDPLRVVDLGCGNAYLTFAAHRYLSDVRGLPVRLTGVDVKEQSREHNTAVAPSWASTPTFVVGSISDAVLDPPPEVVLALHACDTATDEALARAVEWGAPLVLAAPCCHHDVAAQLRKAPTPAPYAMLTRHGILRERLADTLTDAIRASLLRQQGYRVDVVQFVESQHTPRNTMLRATRTGGPVAGGGVRKEYDELVTSWGITPEARGAARCVRVLVALLLPLTLVGADDSRPSSRSRTRRSSSPAAWRSSVTGSSRPTTPATAGGSSRSTQVTRQDRGRDVVVGRAARRRGAGAGRR